MHTTFTDIATSIPSWHSYDDWHDDSRWVCTSYNTNESSQTYVREHSLLSAACQKSKLPTEISTANSTWRSLIHLVGGTIWQVHGTNLSIVLLPIHHIYIKTTPSHNDLLLVHSYLSVRYHDAHIFKQSCSLFNNLTPHHLLTSLYIENILIVISHNICCRLLGLWSALIASPLTMIMIWTDRLL